MPTICELDEYRFFTGNTQQIEKGEGAPLGWVFAEPPTIPEGQHARWHVGAWKLFDRRPPSLQHLKDQKRQEINAERDRRIYVGRIETPVAPVDLRNGRDEANLTKIRTEAQALALSGDTTTTITFRDADNVIHQLTAQQALDMTGAALAYGQQVYVTSWQLKDVDLENASTPEQVEAVVWPEEASN